MAKPLDPWLSNVSTICSTILCSRRLDRRSGISSSLDGFKLRIRSFKLPRALRLIRVKDQPIDYRHNWDNNTLFTSWFFIEIGRQADHHDRGETHFWELENVGAPNTGWGYFTIFALALVPPNLALVHA